MIVVADSGPLNYLILLDQTALLHRFYGDVLVPDAVVNELRAARSPQQVSDWMSRPPSWLQSIPVTAEEVASVSDTLDVGERAALALAERVQADFVLIDETDGRAEAARRGLRVTGTLGVLRIAAEKDLIDVVDVLAQLRTTNFYADEEHQEDLWQVDDRSLTLTEFGVRPCRGRG